MMPNIIKNTPLAIFRLKIAAPSEHCVHQERLIAEFIFGAVILNLFIASFMA